MNHFFHAYFLPVLKYISDLLNENVDVLNTIFVGWNILIMIALTIYRLTLESKGLFDKKMLVKYLTLIVVHFLLYFSVAFTLLWIMDNY